jgi:glucose/arabinose dehydrogenase
MIRVACILALLWYACSAIAAPGREYRIEKIADGLEFPWCIAFLPDGRMLVTERAGRLRVIEDGKLKPEPIGGLPPVYVGGQAGLFDVLPDPDFARNRTLFLSFAHGSRRANHVRIVRARLDDGQLVDVKPIFTAQPAKSGDAHYGARMAFLADGTLVMGTGDGFNYREKAQQLDNHLGKIVRIARDGSVPKDNPFVGDDHAAPEIYSLGHRNVQGLVFDAESGKLYAHEHGPKGGDEVNVIVAGRNYGWPAITYGVDYSGAIISPYTEKPGLEQPLLYWVPSIAPAGMTLYRGAMFPEWRGDLLVSALAGQKVQRVDLDGSGRVGAQHVLFGELGARLRDIRTGPEGAVYLLTDAAHGRVLRVLRSSPEIGGDD